MTGKKQLDGIKRCHYFDRAEYEIFQENVENTSATLRRLVHEELTRRGLIADAKNPEY
jgi:hypothetical protein